MQGEDEDVTADTPERVEVGRREFALVAMLMAFLLAVFPWLREHEEIALVST